MPGLHWFELVPLVILALLIFGPKRLPEMGASIGKTIKEFQKSMREVKEPRQQPRLFRLRQRQCRSRLSCRRPRL